MSADIFDIKRAQRKGTPALIALWGPSGSGKTYSALLLARGLVGPDGRIGVIDTENRRAEFYADMVGGWDHLDLQPPFTPDRYSAAMRAFEQAGSYGCIIVDSMSHVWEGEGGVLDMADQQRTQSGQPLTGLAKWNRPKLAYKKMLNGLLRSPCHVIFCLRAKEKVEQQGNNVVKDGSLVPISEKGFKYEMTVDAQLGKDHIPQELKCPEELLDAFPRGRKISIETGQAIAQWVGAGADWDAAQATREKEARDIASLGTERMRQYWTGLSKAEQQALKPLVPELQALAAQADADGPVTDSEDISDPFAPAPAQTPVAGDALDDTIPADSPTPSAEESAPGPSDGPPAPTTPGEPVADQAEGDPPPWKARYDEAIQAINRAEDAGAIEVLMTKAYARDLEAMPDDVAERLRGHAAYRSAELGGQSRMAV